MYIALSVNCNVLGVVYCVLSMLCISSSILVCVMYIHVYVTGIMYYV